MVVSMLFPSRCASCGAPGPTLCHRCRFSLASSGQLRTPQGIVAAFPFEGVARQLIVALKFRHRRCAAEVLAAHMMRKRVIQLDRGIIVRDQARGVYE